MAQKLVTLQLFHTVLVKLKMLLIADTRCCNKRWTNQDWFTNKICTNTNPQYMAGRSPGWGDLAAYQGLSAFYKSRKQIIQSSYTF